MILARRLAQLSVSSFPYGTPLDRKVSLKNSVAVSNGARPVPFSSVSTRIVSVPRRLVIFCSSFVLMLIVFSSR